MEAGKNPHPPKWSRYLRRIWRPFLSDEELNTIGRAVEAAERRTDVEIHVKIIPDSRGRDMLDLARIQFLTLGLGASPRKAVLLLISHLDHRFAFWGSADIHDRAGHPLWEKAREVLLAHFRERRYPEGLIACVETLGDELARHFPKSPADTGS